MPQCNLDLCRILLSDIIVTDSSRLQTERFPTPSVLLELTKSKRASNRCNQSCNGLAPQSPHFTTQIIQSSERLQRDEEQRADHSLPLRAEQSLPRTKYRWVQVAQASQEYLMKISGSGVMVVLCRGKPERTPGVMTSKRWWYAVCLLLFYQFHFGNWLRRWI